MNAWYYQIEVSELPVNTPVLTCVFSVRAVGTQPPQVLKSGAHGAGIVVKHMQREPAMVKLLVQRDKIQQKLMQQENKAKPTGKAKKGGPLQEAPGLKDWTFWASARSKDKFYRLEGKPSHPI